MAIVEHANELEKIICISCPKNERLVVEECNLTPCKHFLKATDDSIICRIANMTYLSEKIICIHCPKENQLIPELCNLNECEFYVRSTDDAIFCTYDPKNRPLTDRRQATQA